MKTFEFIWAPEGRVVDKIKAPCYRDAREEFKKKHKDTYALYMGEVYVREASR